MTDFVMRSVPDGTESCPHCNGTGRDVNLVDCDQCYYDEECFYCKGTGERVKYKQVETKPDEPTMFIGPAPEPQHQIRLKKDD